MEQGSTVVERVVARLEWVLVNPGGLHIPSDFLPADDAERLATLNLAAVAVTAVAFSAARLLRTEYALHDVLRAGAAVTDGSTFRQGFVRWQAGQILDLACRGANQTRLRRRTEQALRQLPPGQTPPLLTAVLELFIAQARELSHPEPRL